MNSVGVRSKKRDDLILAENLGYGRIDERMNLLEQDRRYWMLMPEPFLLLTSDS